VQELLDFERERQQTLEDQIEFVVAEAEGASVDEATFARMSPEDVRIVKSDLNPLPYESDDGPEYFERDDLMDIDLDEPVDPHAEELARLNEEIANCHRRQRAFEAYLAALGG